MAAIDKTKDTTKTICWGRGDSDPKGFIIQDSNGVAVNITGFAFKLTVNSEKNPSDQVNEQFSITGVLTDAINGKVSFAPTVVDTNIAPTTYFYDIEQTDGAGAISTLIIGKCIIVQDITKV
jgi:hypothetical protein